MVAFVKGGAAGDIFGVNEYLRSTNPKPRYTTYTVAKTSVPAVVVPDGSSQRVLQPGTVMAKITSAAGTSTAADVGKTGPFSAAATDGRQTLTNIVGLEETFVPWQLLEEDVEVSVTYNCYAVQAWCFEMNAGSLFVTLTNTTADAMRGLKGMDIHFV
jgi:hypothetical protein